MSGFFLVVEGPEGAGKTTLAAALAERFRARGMAPTLVREPGGTPVAEVLRAELLDRERPWTPELELLYMATARADLVTHVIRPALGGGGVVISDRYDLSTRAYQGAGRGVRPDFLEAVNATATGGLTPDLTLVLDLPEGEGASRQHAAGKNRDRLDRESPAFHARVAARYRAEQGPGVWHLDATLSPDRLAEVAWTYVEELMPTGMIAATTPDGP